MSPAGTPLSTATLSAIAWASAMFPGMYTTPASEAASAARWSWAARSCHDPMSTAKAAMPKITTRASVK